MNILNRDPDSHPPKAKRHKTYLADRKPKHEVLRHPFDYEELIAQEMVMGRMVEYAFL